MIAELRPESQGTTYPKKYVDEILTDMESMRHDIAVTQQPVFNNIGDLIASLEDDD